MGLIPFPSQVPWSDINPWLGKPSQTFLQYLSSLDGFVRSIVSAGGAPRTVLSAATTFYVGTNGSNANNGLSPSTPWLTLTHAMNVLAGSYDFGGQSVTLQVLAGHATYTETLNIQPWTGAGNLIIDFGGGSNTPAAGNAINSTLGALPGPVYLQNGTLSAPAGIAINNNVPGLIYVNTGLSLGACGQVHIACRATGSIVASNGANYTVSGIGASQLSHFFSELGGLIQIAGITANFSSLASAFTLATAFARDGGFIVTNPKINFTNAGSITGKRYQSDSGGVIDSNSSGANYFPGNVAGTTNGGQYV